MKRSKAPTKERSPDGQSLPTPNTILISIIWYNFTRHEKYDEIKLIKNKMDLNNRKITKSSALSRYAV